MANLVYKLDSGKIVEVEVYVELVGDNIATLRLADGTMFSIRYDQIISIDGKSVFEEEGK